MREGNLSNARILVVEDEPAIARTLAINLAARGYTVQQVPDGRAALLSVSRDPPDLILLDLGLPDLDGVEVLRRIRVSNDLPVIVLTARHESDDKVEALDEGAVDYVTKPFGMDELLARIRSALRRPGTNPPAVAPVSTPHFFLDFHTHQAIRDAHEVHLTPTEWRLLAELVRNQGQVVPHVRLLRAAWGPRYGRESNYLRVYVNQLRRKLEPTPGAPVYLLTEPGMGYRLRLDSG